MHPIDEYAPDNIKLAHIVQHDVSDDDLLFLKQLARAVESGLGVAGPDEIELITGDPESAAYAGQIRQILLQG